MPGRSFRARTSYPCGGRHTTRSEATGNPEQISDVFFVFKGSVVGLFMWLDVEQRAKKVNNGDSK
jgi:hypothetical protein